MTAEDYAEAGVPVPEHMREPWDGTLDDLVGRSFTMRVRAPIPNSVEVHTRCDECGDETGECACDD